MKYPLMKMSDIQSYIPHMQEEKVSEIARSSRGFLHHYNIYGNKVLLLNLPRNDPQYTSHMTWDNKRNSFIARHLEEYNKNKTVRRKLALIAWAYYPD